MRGHLMQKKVTNGLAEGRGGLLMLGHGQPGSVARFFRTMIQGEGEMEWFDAVQQCGSFAVMPVSNFAP